MTRRIKRSLLSFVALPVLLSAAPALAQDVYVPSFMGCAACQMIIPTIETATGDDEQDILVDMAKPCSILPPQDRKGCMQFGATYGPKFIRAIQEKRARGETPAMICGQMGYCQ